MEKSTLKQAVREIRHVLERHDVGAAVTLVSDTHSTFFYHLIPSWSVIRVRGLKHGFRTRRLDFGSSDDQKRSFDLSFHMICKIRDLNAQAMRDMQAIINSLGDDFDIEHKPFNRFDPDSKLD